MASRLLLPNRFKLVGWLIAIPAFILMLFVLHGDFAFEFLNFSRGSTDSLQVLFDSPTLFSIRTNNFTDEIGGILLIIGLLLIAFSKEKDEDERIATLRLESLLWAVLINSILLILAIVVLYNGLFLQVMCYNICTTLILFVVRFNWKLFAERRNAKIANL
jgi:small-conductance mechanosensitive channel